MVIRNTFFRFLVVFLLVSKLLRFGIWCLFAISKKTVFCFCDFFTFFQDKKNTCLLNVLKTRFQFSLFWRCFSSKRFFLCFCVSVLGVFFYMNKKMVSFLKDRFFHDNVKLHFIKA